MATCNNNPRLSISNSGVSGVVCQPGNANCGNVQSSINCCEGLSLSRRKNRENVRDKLHDYILKKLGAPSVELELDEQHVDLAIDEAFDVWEAYAPKDYYRYMTFATEPGKSVYQLPDEVGHIRAVYYKQTPTLPGQANDLGGSIPVEYFYPGTSMNAGSAGFMDPHHPTFGAMGQWTLYSQYMQMYSNLSSQIGGWEWAGGINTIKIYPVPCRQTHVIVHYLQRCTDWECNHQAIREGALAYATKMLGEIRSKFQNIPGPNGGIVLNGESLIQRGQDAIDKWEERLITRYGDIPTIFWG